MRLTLGIAIGADRVRAVALSAGRVVAANETEIDPGQGLAGALAELFATAPLPRFPRPRVVVALGPSLAQTRRIAGLPPLDDPKALALMVREGASKFFLRNGVPLATTGVRVLEPGVVWAAALDERAVAQADAGCRAAGLRVERFVPSVAVLGRALSDGEVVWADGPAAAHVTIAGGEMSTVRRLSAAQAADAPPPAVIPALARLGDDAWRWADAYGAASLPNWEPLSLRPSAARDGVPNWRMGLAATAAVLALLFAALAPATRAMRAHDDASARLATLQARHRAALDTDRELSRVTGALWEAAEFNAKRFSPTLLLADVTAALPPGSALVSFRADTASGTLVALAPGAASLVQPLEKVPGLVQPEIVGAVTREALLGRNLERVTIRFGIDPARRVPSPEAAP